MKYLKPKVSIIGAGNVGSTFAFALMTSGLAREIVLIDMNEEKALCECMDLNHGLSFAPPAKIYSSGYSGCESSDIVVITAGARQKPGQTRIDLVQANSDIFKQMIPEIQKYADNAILLVVSNPVDILTYITMQISHLPSNRVIGSGTVLDTSRFRYLLGDHCNVDTRNVHAYIIGEHGDTELPVWSNANIGGMLFEKYCPTCDKNHACQHHKQLHLIFEQVKDSAYKIIKSKGATYYAIALALVKITGAILRDENSILPVSTLINDYYGINDVCLSIPSLVNRNGVEKFLKLELASQEQEQLIESAQSLKAVVKNIKL